MAKNTGNQDFAQVTMTVLGLSKAPLTILILLGNSLRTKHAFEKFTTRSDGKILERRMGVMHIKKRSQGSLVEWPRITVGYTMVRFGKVINMFKRLKRGKAVVPDQILNEMFHGDARVVETMVQSFKIVVKHARILPVD